MTIYIAFTLCYTVNKPGLTKKNIHGIYIGYRCKCCITLYTTELGYLGKDVLEQTTKDMYLNKAWVSSRAPA